MNIFENEVVATELKRLVTLIGTDEGRDVLVDINILKKAIDRIDKALINGNETFVKIHCDMWEECIDSLEKILSEFNLDTNKEKSNFEYHEWHIVRKQAREVDFALTRIFYIYGCLEAQNLLDESINDLEQIESICVKIADNWSNMVDIKDVEEEGYPTAYAERVLLEKFSRKK